MDVQEELYVLTLKSAFRALLLHRHFPNTIPLTSRTALSMHFGQTGTFQ